MLLHLSTAHSFLLSTSIPFDLVAQFAYPLSPWMDISVVSSFAVNKTSMYISIQVLLQTHFNVLDEY